MRSLNSLGIMMSIVIGVAMCAAPPAFAADSAGKIILIKGDVYILDSKANIVGDPLGKRGRKTQVGAEFFVGETLSTKPGARVKLQFLEGANEVVLGSDTTMLIERAGNGADKKGTSLNLSKGEVRSDVKVKYSGQGADVYEVKSKNAVAGVRGTIFTAIFNPKSSKFTIATERGAVSVSALGKGAASAQLVTAGKFSSTVGEIVAPPAPISSNPELARDVEALGGGSSDNGSGEGAAPGGDKADAQPASDDKKDGAAVKSDEGKAPASADNGEAKSDAQAAKGESGKPAEAKPETAKSEAKADAPAAAVKNESSPPLGREMVSAAPASSGSAANSPNRAPAAMAPPMGPILGDASKNTSFKSANPVLGLPGNLGTILDGAKSASNQQNTNIQTLPTKGTVRVKIE